MTFVWVLWVDRRWEDNRQLVGVFASSDEDTVKDAIKKHESWLGEVDVHCSYECDHFLNFRIVSDGKFTGDDWELERVELQQ